MRAGAFSESRVVDLIQRRFVPTFYNVSGQGEGGSEAATAFVAGRTENPYAFLAAFAPDGELLGETELYADKDAVHAWLVGLLREHPECDHETEAERATLAGEPLAAARLLEGLGRGAEADARYASLGDDPRALAGRLRLARHAERWEAHAELEARLRAILGPDGDAAARAALELEHGRRLLATGEAADARAHLQAMARAHGDTPSAAGLHLEAGRACWFDDDRPWAAFHFVHVAETWPDDLLARRAYVAAAAEAMPYANPELGGYAAPVGNIGTQHIVDGYAAARAVHDRLLPEWEAGRAGGSGAPDAAPDGAPDPDAPAPLAAGASDVDRARARELVAGLRDGAAHLPDANRRAQDLADLGEVAIEPLVEALNDPAFEGRGAAATALGLVSSTTERRVPEAVEALERAVEGEDRYLRTLARTALRRVPDEDRPPEADDGSDAPDPAEGDVGAPPPPPRPASPLVLVAALRDDAPEDAADALAARILALGDAPEAALRAALDDAAFPGVARAAELLARLQLRRARVSADSLAALKRLAASEDATRAAAGRAALARLEW